MRKRRVDIRFFDPLWYWWRVFLQASRFAVERIALGLIALLLGALGGVLREWFLGDRTWGKGAISAAIGGFILFLLTIIAHFCIGCMRAPVELDREWHKRALKLRGITKRSISRGRARLGQSRRELDETTKQLRQIQQEMNSDPLFRYCRQQMYGWAKNIEGHCTRSPRADWRKRDDFIKDLEESLKKVHSGWDQFHNAGNGELRAGRENDPHPWMNEKARVMKQMADDYTPDDIPAKLRLEQMRKP